MKRKIKVFIATLMVTMLGIGNTVCYADISGTRPGQIRYYNITGSLNIYTSSVSASLTSTGYVNLDLNGGGIISHKYTTDPNIAFSFSACDGCSAYIYTSVTVNKPNAQRVNSAYCNFYASYDTAKWSDSISLIND